MKNNSKDTPRYLYKYHTLNVYLFELLTRHELYLANRQELNDPFDLSISIDAKAYRELYLTKYPFAKNDEKSLQLTVDNLEYFYLRDKDYYFDKLRDVIPKEILDLRVTCFTEKRNNPLMWAHYTDNHFGVCIKFDLQKDDNLRNALKSVKYLKTLPRIRNEVDFQKRLLIKETSWQTEKEWRIVSDKSKFSFKPEAIKEIIFGLNSPANILSWFSYFMEGAGLSDVILTKVILSGDKLIKIDQFNNRLNISDYRPKKKTQFELNLH
jgi:hypothetical protein